MIGIENPYNKQVKAVYCHWDGYLAHNGAILVEHYTNSAKANNLIALGDISSLRPEIGVKHSFSRLDTDLPDAEYDRLYGDMTTYYGRDRDEGNSEFRVFLTAADAIEHYEHSWAEYYYLYRYSKATDYESGEWFYRKESKGRWLKVRTALKSI
jgi:hypothetical protein